MEKFGDFAQRWRYLIVAVEALVAVGCVYFGLKVVSSPQAQVQVRHAPARPPETGVTLGLPSGLPARTPGRPSPSRTPRVLGLTADGVARLNHDDFELYRRQWQVLQMLMDGVRTYLEQRVVPQLLSR